MVLMIESGISLADIHRELASRHVIDKKVKQETSAAVLAPEKEGTD